MQRQYCGNTGKTDNCVVTVHLSYCCFDTAFRTMLDSTLYLPESWHLDRPRCREAGIPDDVAYRPSYKIAPREKKFFLAHAPLDTPLETLLHVAFARWPVERCLEDKKTELGLSHFEVRKYPALERHFLITLVSHLLLAQQTERLRGEKPAHHAVPGPHRRQRLDRYAAVAP